ncbi:trypsin-like serine protease [Inquilinus sp. CAU 1745]|uniref:trypsin-like serine peptidase n=1 Tax=Inquilinus sp. CAU 1745 TaxID=3140369 RepID=UPI00325AF817
MGKPAFHYSAAIAAFVLWFAGQPPAMAQSNSCQWANDGECDETRFGGTGACPAGTDTVDCKMPRATGDSCRWAFDMECDEPGLGTGACDPGTDTTDCRSLAAGGDNSCQWAHDGECDEPWIGTGFCTSGTDLADCQPAYPWRNRDNDCETAFNGRCEEPGFASASCPALSDTVDCLGRATPARIRDHYFGSDDRVRLPPDGFPWTAIGLLRFENGDCTAALVAPRIILTAAHCFFNGTSRVLPTEFLAGHYGDTNVGRAQIISTYVAPGYDPHGEVDDYTQAPLDWGFALLDRDLGTEIGTFDILVPSTEDVAFAADGGWQPVTQAGYSGDSPDHLTGHVDCEIVRFNDNGTMIHRCDTTYGDSGSPIFIERDGHHFIVAIDSSFVPNVKGPSSNRAVDARSFGEQLARYIRNEGVMTVK